MSRGAKGGSSRIKEGAVTPSSAFPFNAASTSVSPPSSTVFSYTSILFYKNLSLYGKGGLAQELGEMIPSLSSLPPPPPSLLVQKYYRAPEFCSIQTHRFMAWGGKGGGAVTLFSPSSFAATSASSFPPLQGFSRSPSVLYKFIFLRRGRGSSRAKIKAQTKENRGGQKRSGQFRVEGRRLISAPPLNEFKLQAGGDRGRLYSRVYQRFVTGEA